MSCSRTKAKNRLVITIDGPVAAGKTTAARHLAIRLGLPLLDTGAIYRCVAFAARQVGADWRDEQAVAAVATALDIQFITKGRTHRVFLGALDVSESIREPEISQGASIVSAIPGVRAALLQVQRDQATKGDLIAEGRDTGTVVFPDAKPKFFLTAEPEARARRRYLELRENGIEVEISQVLAELAERDHRDSNRSLAPLLAAPDAITIDSTRMSAVDVTTKMHLLVSNVRSRIKP